MYNPSITHDKMEVLAYCVVRNSRMDGGIT